MARSDKKHYIKIRERYVKCCLDLLSDGKFKSQTELATTLGVHPVQLNKLIKVVKNKLTETEAPTLDMVVDISMMFGYSCEWIMTGTGAMKIKESEKQRLARYEDIIDKMIALVDAR